MSMALSDLHAPVAKALARHMAWQRNQLRSATRDPTAEAPRFLVLRPGTYSDLCRKVVGDGTCFRASPPRMPESLAAHEHWDDLLTANRTDGAQRLLPGMGNIMVAVASAAVVALLSRRVLLVENWTATGTFDAPLSELLVGLGTTTGWEPHLARAQAMSREETFLAHDGSWLANRICSSDLSSWPPARVWRIFSNQYFLPLLRANPFHHAALSGMESRGGGLWAPLVQTLLRPAPALRARIERFERNELRAISTHPQPSTASSASSRTPLLLTMHVRCSFPLSGWCSSNKLASYARCARARIAAARRRDTQRSEGAARPVVLFIATMHDRDRRTLAALLSDTGAKVTHVRGAAAERVESGVRWQEDGRVLDTYLLSLGSELLLTPGSTFGYVAIALAAPSAMVTMLDTCRSPPMRESPFHVFKHALRTSSACRNRAAALTGDVRVRWDASLAFF